MCLHSQPHALGIPCILGARPVGATVSPPASIRSHARSARPPALTSSRTSGASSPRLDLLDRDELPETLMCCVPNGDGPNHLATESEPKPERSARAATTATACSRPTEPEPVDG